MAGMRKEYLWALITLIIAIVLSLILVNIAKDGAQSKVSVCVTTAQRDHIRSVMLTAVDHALDEQVGKLFANWVLDGTGQPGRAQVGTNNAVKAHIVARANVLAWDPAECAASFQLQSADAKPWR
jgi:hypothetical protein